MAKKTVIPVTTEDLQAPEDILLANKRLDEEDASPDVVRDVIWAYSKLSLPESAVTVNDAPSLGAWGMLQYARKYNKPFYENLVAKAMIAKGRDGDEDNVRKERMKIEEIRKIISRFKEVAAE